MIIIINQYYEIMILILLIHIRTLWNISTDEEDEHDLEDKIEFIPFPGEKDNNGNIDADHSRYNEELSKEIKYNLIGTSVLLPTGGRILEGVMRSRKGIADGKQLKGNENKNHILDTRT